MMEVTVLNEIFNAFFTSELCLNTVLPQKFTNNSLTSGLCLFFALSETCIVGVYIDKCVPFQIMSNQLKETRELQLRCEHISRIISKNRMGLNSIFNVMVVYLRYINYLFFSFNLFHICKHFKQTSSTLSL